MRDVPWRSGRDQSSFLGAVVDWRLDDDDDGDDDDDDDVLRANDIDDAVFVGRRNASLVESWQAMTAAAMENFPLVVNIIGCIRSGP
jgi:hypothetical protein